MTFLYSPGPEQRHEVCETDSHVQLLPQMDDTKQKEETDFLSLYLMLF